MFVGFKHGYESQSNRERRYRFCKEFFEDLESDKQIQPLQLLLGYEGLGGPRRRSTEEIRYVLELSKGTPDVIDIHRRAALGQVRFDSLVRQFSWTGWHANRSFRWLINLGCAVVYIAGPYLGFYLMYTKYAQASSLLTSEFALHSLIAGVYFVGVPIFGLIYVMRMNESARLVRLSQTLDRPVTHPQRRLRSALRRVSATFKARDGFVGRWLARRFAQPSSNAPLSRAEADKQRRPS